MGFPGLLTGMFSGLGGALAGAKTKDGSGIDAVRTAANIIDRLYTSDEERLDRSTALARILREADDLQTAVNRVEAASKSLLVAGWRPFIGWICGIALGWHFLAQPVLIFTFESMGYTDIDWPVFDLTTLDTILFGMLGLGTLRTAEKATGRA